MTPRRRPSFARMAAQALFVAIGLSALAFASAQGAPTTAPAPRAKPPIPIPAGESLIERSRVSGQVAYIVVDAETGVVLDALAPDLPLPPASVAKAPTAVYALDALGADYRFETRVVAVGARTGAELSGDLILQGGGDPALDTVDLNSLVEDLAARGVRTVTGRFLVDSELLPAVDRIDPEQSDHADYNPSVGALNLNFNRVYAQWRQRAGGVEVSVEAHADGLAPRTDHARVELAPRTRTSPFEYQLIDDREVWWATSRALGRQGARWLPTRRPAIYAARTFRDLARRAGISLPAPERGAAPLVAEILARRESEPMADIVRKMLRYSTNLTAEALGLAATRALGGAAFGLEDSAGSMNAWGAAFAGFPAGDAGLQLTNHSGLSSSSRASVRRIADILVAAERRAFGSRVATPPESGAILTLRDLLPETPFIDSDARAPEARATVRAKTGTLDFVNALAGYVDIENGPDQGGRRLAFAIIAADLLTRASAPAAGAESRRGAKTYNTRARRLQRALIRSWIDRFNR